MALPLAEPGVHLLELPNDVLSLILRMRTPPSRAAASTCRRLRALQLSLITTRTLKCSPHTWQTEALRTLHSLPNLRSLTVASISRSCDFEPIPTLPHLTALHLLAKPARLAQPDTPPPPRLVRSASATDTDTALAWGDFASEAAVTPLVASVACFGALQDLRMTSLGLSARDASALACLTVLTRLDLSRNRLRGEGARALQRLTGLVDLALASNTLGPIGSRAVARGNTNLQALNLANNQLNANNMRAIAQLGMLTRLDVSRNSQVSASLGMLSALTRLRCLTLGHNQMTAQHVQLLRAVPALRSLNISGNCSLAASLGIRELASLTALEALCLRGCGPAGGGMAHLTALTALTRLAADNLSLTLDDARDLAKLTSLRALSANGNSALGDEGATSLAALLALSKLSLAQTGVSAHGLQSLTALQSLRTLNLDLNNLRGRPAAHSLTKLTRLQRLSLCHNRLGDGAGVLAALTSLRTLELVDNGIGDSGAVQLAGMIELVHLKLGGNTLGVSARRALGSMRASVDLETAPAGPCAGTGDQVVPFEARVRRVVGGAVHLLPLRPLLPLAQHAVVLGAHRHVTKKIYACAVLLLFLLL